MNKIIKKKIIENEYALLNNVPAYEQSIKQFIKKIETANYDKMLYDLIIKSFASKDKFVQEQKYNELGLLSSRQLINKYIKELDLSDQLKLDDLVEEEYYSALDICALADNYNNQVGMYYIPENDSIIIKSTVEDNNRPYDDRWIKKGVILKYYMQTEKESNVNSLSFSHKPNAMVFNSLMEGRAVNIYVFVNTKKGLPFAFKGVFHPCGLVDGNKAFLLFKHGYDSEIPYDNLDAQFLMTLLRTGVCPSIELGLVKRDRTISLNNDNYVSIIKSKRNIIQQKKIDLEVALRGEEIVLQYEKRKLGNLGRQDLAEKVVNVSLKDMNVGFDIHSYSIDSEGSVSDLYIKVHSTVTNINKTLLLTANEYDNLLRKSDEYKLYKVYNIYTDQPRLFIVDRFEKMAQV